MACKLAPKDCRLRRSVITAPILDYTATIQVGGNDLLQSSPLFDPIRLVQNTAKCTETYLCIGCDKPAARFLRQVTLVDCVEGLEGIAVYISKLEQEPCHYWFDLATVNSLLQVTLENRSRLLYAHGFAVVRARLDIISVGNGTITMFHAPHAAGVTSGQLGHLQRLARPAACTQAPQKGQVVGSIDARTCL